MTTGEAIRAARKAAGLSQADLAREMKLSQPYISKIERGLAGSKSEIDRLVTRLKVKEQPSRLPDIRFPPSWRPPHIAALPGPAAVEVWQRPQMSGDAFAAIELAKDGLLLLGLDVAGHGLASFAEATYVTGWTRGWIRAQPFLIPTAESVASAFAEMLRQLRIDAAFCVVILSRAAKGIVTYECSIRGFPAPILVAGRPPAGQQSAALSSDAQDGAFHAEFPTPLSLILASDGLLARLGAGVEADGRRTLQRWQSGESREQPLMQLLATNSGLSDDELAARVRWMDWDESASVTLENSEIERYIRQVGDRAEGNGLAARRTDIESALNEVLSNAYVHGFKRSAGTVILRTHASDREFVIEVEDFGVGGPIREAGGYGLLRKYADDVDSRKAAMRGTIVTLTFRKIA